MGPELLGGLSFVVLFGLIFLGMPIGVALGLVGFVGMGLLAGWSAAMGLFTTVPFSVTATYTYITIPLFILMGCFAFHSGVVKEAFNAAFKWFGRVRGGLGMATIAACTGFAACTGLSAVSVSLFALTTLPEMERRNYSQSLATGVIAAGTTLGILIPPSIPLITYAILSDASIGALFMAGIVPGLMLAALFMIVVLVWARLQPTAAPAGLRSSWWEKLLSLKGVWAMLALMSVVMGGIWGGVFTPVEAGGIGAFGALIIGLVKRNVGWRAIRDSLLDTARMSGMMFVLLIGVMMFNHFFILTRLPAVIAEGIVNLSIPPVAILILMIICWLVGGCFVDTFGLMMLTLPVFIPIARGIGIDLITFGILHVICIEIGAISPPIGINLFMMSGVAKHVPMNRIMRGVIPFVLIMLFALGIFVAFPELVMWLPGLMRH
ncbi:MAG: TRAP transporter large permease subunit [Actinobacteria bacterium]|nr:TRAP transporter large permease subunit [Actinomycetota bacterium]